MIRTHPVRDVLLVHGVLVDFILTRTRPILILIPNVFLDSEAELGLLSANLVKVVLVVGVSEVEIAQDRILGPGRGKICLGPLASLLQGSLLLLHFLSQFLLTYLNFLAQAEIRLVEVLLVTPPSVWV